jgi:hypothetical protein
MTVKDKNGRVLSSENPTIIGIWTAAGYEEVKAKRVRKTAEAETTENETTE